MRACMIVQTPFIQDNDVQMKLDFLQIKYYSIVMGVVGWLVRVGGVACVELGLREEGGKSE